MKKLTILSTVALLFFITSCSTDKHKDEQNQSEETHENHDPTTAVQLVNGGKWMANVETTQGIQSMTQMVEGAQADPTSLAKPLKESLLLEFTDILNKCTMKGESHEQLHNYLLPLKADIEKLSASPSAEELESIKSYLTTYYNYFE